MLNIDDYHRFRVGRTLGLTLYAQHGIDASKADTFLALFDTPEWAEGVAGALNGTTTEDRRLMAVDRLLYPRALTGSIIPMELGDFVGVATSPQVAWYLAARTIRYTGYGPPPVSDA